MQRKTQFIRDITLTRGDDALNMEQGSPLTEDCDGNYFVVQDCDDGSVRVTAFVNTDTDTTDRAAFSQLIAAQVFRREDVTDRVAEVDLAVGLGAALFHGIPVEIKIP